MKPILAAILITVSIDQHVTVGKLLECWGDRLSLLAVRAAATGPEHCCLARVHVQCC